MFDFTILHLSDTQFGTSSRFKSGKILGESIITDIRGMIKNGELKINSTIQMDNADRLLKESIDLILVTGDIAETGHTREYLEALNLLETLSEGLSIENKRIFLLPGNHDIDFSGGNSYRSRFLSFQNSLLSRFYGQEHAELYLENRPYEFFYYPVEAPVVLFACLNSAYGITERRQKKICFDVEILKKLCDEIVSRPELRVIPLRIMSLHHNFVRSSKNDDECLSNADELFPLLLKNEFRFLFHGHRHFTDIRTISRPDASYPLTVLSTGSTGLNSERLPAHYNQYQIVRFLPFSVTIYPRRYNPQIISGGLAGWLSDTPPIYIPMTDVIHWFHVQQENENKLREICQENLINNDPQFVNLLAHSGASYLNVSGSIGKQFLKKQFLPGKLIRVLLQDPRKPTAAIRGRAQGKTVQELSDKIPFTRIVDLYNTYTNIEFRFTDSVYCSLFYTDKGMFYDPYHLGKLGDDVRPENNFVVGFIKPGVTDYYERLSNHFEFLWTDESTSSMEEVYEYKKKEEPGLQLLKKRPAIGNYRLVSLHDSWISVDPIAGCNGGCKYCYLREYPLCEGKANEMSSEQFFEVPENAEAIIEHVEHFPYLSIDPQVFCIGNFTDMFIKKNEVKLRLLLTAWNNKLASSSAFINPFIGIITKHKIPDSFLTFLNALTSIRERVFFVLSHSGLEKADLKETGRLELNIDQAVFISNITKIKAKNANWKIIHFWRPLVKANASDEKINEMLDLLTAQKVDASVCVPLRTNIKFESDLSVNGEIRWDGLEPVWSDEEIAKQQRENELLFKIAQMAKQKPKQQPIYFHTSCAVSFITGIDEYNGTYFRRTYCSKSNCPDEKRQKCTIRAKDYKPDHRKVIRAAADCGVFLHLDDFKILDDNILIDRNISQDAHRVLTRKLKFPIKVTKKIKATTEWFGSIISTDPEVS